jgi:RNA polymerase sigma factor (sigma-70 family)
MQPPSGRPSEFSASEFSASEFRPSESALSDLGLVRGAQRGDAESLGLLLERHQPGMRAVALSILGHGPDAEDAVQDAALVALARIGDLRDPAAAGPWLRMIVRNGCLMQLRSRSAVPPAAGLLAVLPLASGDPTPEQIIDGHAMRDWIWHAIGELSPPLRLVIMLRHFSEVSSYEQIAAICGIPVGTVRSRLSQARAKMTGALQSAASAAHADAGELTAARRREAIETLAAAERGDLAAVIADRWAPDAEMITSRGQRGGTRRLIAAMDADISAGVHQRLVSAVASRDVSIWEMGISNPPEDPAHCPPAVTWLLTHHSGRIQGLRLFHPRPPHRRDS